MYEEVSCSVSFKGAVAQVLWLLSLRPSFPWVILSCLWALKVRTPSFPLLPLVIDSSCDLPSCPFHAIYFHFKTSLEVLCADHEYGIYFSLLSKRAHNVRPLPPLGTLDHCGLSSYWRTCKVLFPGPWKHLGIVLYILESENSLLFYIVLFLPYSIQVFLWKLSYEDMMPEVLVFFFFSSLSFKNHKVLKMSGSLLLPH